MNKVVRSSMALSTDPAEPVHLTFSIPCAQAEKVLTENTSVIEPLETT